MAGSKFQRWLKALEKMLQLYVGSFDGGPEHYACVDCCMGISAVTPYVIVLTPHSAFQSTTPLL